MPRRYDIQVDLFEVLIWAEQNLEEWLRAHHGVRRDPGFADAYAHNAALWRRIRAYRRKRFGETRMERIAKTLTPVNIFELIGHDKDGTSKP